MVWESPFVGVVHDEGVPIDYYQVPCGGGVEEINTILSQKTNLDSEPEQDDCKIHLVQQQLSLTPAASSFAKGVSRW